MPFNAWHDIWHKDLLATSNVGNMYKMTRNIQHFYCRMDNEIQVYNTRSRRGVREKTKRLCGVGAAIFREHSNDISASRVIYFCIFFKVTGLSLDDSRRELRTRANSWLNRASGDNEKKRCWPWNSKLSGVKMKNDPFGLFSNWAKYSMIKRK